MSNNNVAMISGRLGKDAELRYTSTGKSVLTFSVACGRTWGKGADRKEQTEWFNVEVWGPYGEMLSKHLAKGDFVAVVGRFQTESWEKDGEKRYKTKVVADNVDGPFWKKSEQQKQKESASGCNDLEDDDIPF